MPRTDCKQSKKTTVRFVAVLAILLVIASSFVVLVLSDVAYSEEDTFTADGLEYAFIDDQNVKVTGVVSDYFDNGVITVPSETKIGEDGAGKTYKVILAASGAFADCDGLRIIRVPDHIQFEAGAFGTMDSIYRVYVTGTDDAVTDYSQLMNNLPAEVRDIVIDSTAEVVLSSVLGIRSPNFIGFRSVTANAVIDGGLEFYDDSGNLLQDSGDLAGKRFYAGEEPGTWMNEPCPPSNLDNEPNSLVYVTLTMALVIVFLLIAFISRRLV